MAPIQNSSSYSRKRNNLVIVGLEINVYRKVGAVLLHTGCLEIHGEVPFVWDVFAVHSGSKSDSVNPNQSQQTEFDPCTGV
jgi:hypothetical protein